MNWQPIETGPKDGTHVLLFYPGKRIPVRIGKYLKSETFSHGVLVSHVEGWSDFGDSMVMDLWQKCEPSMWHPIPETPSE